eukprot:GILK01010187.1.p1 GENE.GILK01010187.1~~GILK01010187.1.p1  ORF type:complete len:246 (+),score=27.94 GILK01010187.1:36-740(+)
MSDAHVLGYWNIRGLAAPIRMAFAFAGKELKEDVYGIDSEGKPCDNWEPEYKKMKEEGTHAYPNLPYLRVPGTKTILVQSSAILRYAGRAFGLYGQASDALSVSLVDEFMEEMIDIRSDAVDNYYSKAISESFINGTLPYAFTVCQKRLEQSKASFFFGAAPTIADFVAYEVLRTPLPLIEDKREQYEKDYPLVFAFLKAVEALPQLEAYLKSDQHSKYSANGSMANFGNTPTL